MRTVALLAVALVAGVLEIGVPRVAHGEASPTDTIEVTEVSEEAGVLYAAAKVSCGTYPSCKSSVCWGTRQRCPCIKDDKNKTCSVGSCYHDDTCPK